MVWLREKINNFQLPAHISGSQKNLSGLNGQAVADPGGVQGVSLEPSSLPPVFKYCMKMK